MENPSDTNKPIEEKDRDARMIQKIYEAMDVPYDGAAYETLKAKVKRKYILRVVLRAILCVFLLLVIAGGVGAGVVVYKNIVNITAPVEEESVIQVKGPASVEGHVEGDYIVIQLRPGTYAIDYDRIYALRKDKGNEKTEVICDQEAGIIRLPYYQESMVYTIYLFDVEGNSFVREASVTLKPVQ